MSIDETIDETFDSYLIVVRVFPKNFFFSFFMII